MTAHTDNASRYNVIHPATEATRISGKDDEEKMRLKLERVK
ncbi:hypothetical protein ACSQ67_006786 [Phaseolus vulgaris]